MTGILLPDIYIIIPLYIIAVNEPIYLKLFNLYFVAYFLPFLKKLSFIRMVFFGVKNQCIFYSFTKKKLLFGYSLTILAFQNFFFAWYFFSQS